ncbi:hypothetical protein D3C72_457020 [compost metagenome]
MPKSAFEVHCQDGMKRFVQTALVIDNEANLGPVGSPNEDETPRRATRVQGGILGTGEARADDSGYMSGSDPSQTNGEDTSHTLNAKLLTDAFLTQSVICGLYKPSPSEEMVRMSTDAALHADLVVIDWYLDDSKNSVKAKEIIANILKDDLRQRGRLRLIAVYTSQPRRLGIAAEVFDYLSKVSELTSRFSLSPDGYSIMSADTRICFLNKPQTIGPDIEIVSEADLPARLIEEFATLTSGILPTFALNSLASVRRAAHHIVAVFSKHLDGAFLSHRCVLPHPEDANEFAFDLIADQLRTIISVDLYTGASISAEVLETWVDDEQTRGHLFTDHIEAVAPPDLVKQFIRHGGNRVDKPEGQHVKGDPNRTISRKKAINKVTLPRIFYSGYLEAWNRSKQFARLVTLKREANGFTVFPSEWRPILSLGSVLKVLPQGLDYEETPQDAIDAPYLFCVQPRCDSVRLKVKTGFPFQSVTASTKSGFNIVIRDDDEFGNELMIELKPRDTRMISFVPDPSTETVRGEWNAELKGYVFTDVHYRKFLWLGDVKDLKAQGDASQLAARVHSVGIDDFEWLRMASDGDVQWP